MVAVHLEVHIFYIVAYRGPARLVARASVSSEMNMYFRLLNFWPLVGYIELPGTL